MVVAICWSVNRDKRGYVKEMGTPFLAVRLTLTVWLWVNATHLIHVNTADT